MIDSLRDILTSNDAKMHVQDKLDAAPDFSLFDCVVVDTWDKSLEYVTELKAKIPIQIPLILITARIQRERYSHLVCDQVRIISDPVRRKRMVEEIQKACFPLPIRNSPSIHEEPTPEPAQLALPDKVLQIMLVEGKSFAAARWP